MVRFLNRSSWIESAECRNCANGFPQSRRERLESFSPQRRRGSVVEAVFRVVKRVQPGGEKVIVGWPIWWRNDQ